MLAEQLVARAPGGHRRDGLARTAAPRSIEAAIKLSRAATGRPRILHAEHSFHGLTTGALSLNGNEEFRERFGPFMPGCDPVPFGDLDALERELAAGDVAAFIVEPIQGKGVNLPPPGYLQGAQERCRAAGALFVSTRSRPDSAAPGRFFALEHWGPAPDMVCVAKALSGGFVPVGGVLVSPRGLDAVFDGDGARGAATARPSAATTSPRRPGSRRCRDRAGGARRAPRGWASCCSS